MWPPIQSEAHQFGSLTPKNGGAGENIGGMMLKIIEMAKMSTPIKKDGATDLGALIGAIVGASLVYWGLASLTTHPLGSIIVLTVAAGAFIGLAIGIGIGSLIDLRLTPKVDQIADEDADHKISKNLPNGRR
jgi:hypothetical protein